MQMCNYAVDNTFALAVYIDRASDDRLSTDFASSNRLLFVNSIFVANILQLNQEIILLLNYGSMRNFVFLRTEINEKQSLRRNLFYSVIIITTTILYTFYIFLRYTFYVSLHIFIYLLNCYTLLCKILLLILQNNTNIDNW